MEIKIVDKGGKWYQSAAGFRFVDPETGTAFEPGVATQATPSDWLALQAEVIPEIADPTAPEEKPGAKKATPSA